MECVNFDAEEEVVAAGGQNGTVKIWDLNATQGEHLDRVCSCTYNLVCFRLYGAPQVPNQADALVLPNPPPPPHTHATLVIVRTLPAIFGSSA